MLNKNGWLLADNFRCIFLFKWKWWGRTGLNEITRAYDVPYHDIHHDEFAWRAHWIILIYLNNVLHNMIDQDDKDILRFAGYPTITHYIVFVLMTDAIQVIIIKHWSRYIMVVWIPSTVWMKFVPRGSIHNNTTLAQWPVQHIPDCIGICMMRITISIYEVITTGTTCIWNNRVKSAWHFTEYISMHQSYSLYLNGKNIPC